MITNRIDIQSSANKEIPLERHMLSNAHRCRPSTMTPTEYFPQGRRSREAPESPSRLQHPLPLSRP